MKPALAVPLAALLGGLLMMSLREESEVPRPTRRMSPAVVPVASPAPEPRDVAPSPIETPFVEKRRDAPSEMSALLAERRAERDLWEELEILPEAVGSRPACRAIILRRTAEHLGLSGRFEPAAEGAASEIAQSWARRNALIESVDASLAPDQREIQEREIQDRYEADKRTALARVDAVLRPEGRHRRFRARLEEWIDLVR